MAENKRLDSIVAQKKADSKNANVTPSPLTPQQIPYDSLLTSLQERILYDSAMAFNLKSEIGTLRKTNDDFSNNIKANNDFIRNLERNIDSQKNMINQLKIVHFDLAEKKAYARMYQSHIDTIIDHAKNSEELQKRVNTLLINRDGFKKKFELPY